MTAPVTTDVRTRRARNAVMVSFAFNGFAFANWVARLPDAVERLRLDDASLGWLLLCASAGALAAMSSSGRAVQTHGPRRVVQVGTVAATSGIGLLGVGVGGLGSTAVAALALLVFGAGYGVWDVAMNVEGAEVERRLGRTIMPRFHAGYSVGTVAGALVGAGMVRLDVPLLPHLVGAAALAALASLTTVGRFVTEAMPATEEHTPMRAREAWREPRTLLIGLMVLGVAMAEGAANDWLALALERGHDAERWVAVSGFALFVTAMTVGRFVGPIVLDRFDRMPMLYGSIASMMVGISLVVASSSPWLVGLGILVWGLGSALGFPVGMSAAADDPLRAAPRVSVVALIGYCAFLVGPPLIGFVGHAVGTLDALLTLVVVLVPAALCVPAARRLRTS